MAAPSFAALDPVARYMRLLLAAETRRVSTLEDTSTSPTLTAQAAWVDKLCAELATPISRDTLISRLKAANIAFRPTKLRDKRWYLETGDPETGLYFFLGHQNATEVRKLTSRPSAFSSFSAYRSALSRALSEHELSEMRLSRVDLALDYDAPLAEILEGLDVSHKRVRIAYNDEGSTRTGITIGKGAETIVVYDKARESKLPQPRTRIEIQLKGGKLPTRKLGDLSTRLTSPKGPLFWQYLVIPGRSS